MACGALAGAAGGLVDQGAKCMQGQHGACSAGSFVKSAVIGGVGGALGGGVSGAFGGALVRAEVSKGLPAVVNNVINGGVSGGMTGGAMSALSYGLNCSHSSAGCSWSGAAGAAASGAEQGAVAGAIGGGAASTKAASGAAGGLRNVGKGLRNRFSKCGRSRGGPHSFTAATGVLMADGTSKPISMVKAGDKVANTVPGDEKKTETHTVEKVIVTETDHDFVDLTIATHDAHGRPDRVGKLTTTDHHPFYDITQAAFVDAAGLKPGDHLQQPGGHTAEILEVRRYTATQTTYDLTINGLHTYYVEAGNTPVLVHNCGGNAAIDADRLAHIEYRHGPGAQEMAKAAGEEDIPGEFNEEFIWDGDNHVLGDRLIEGANNSPELPNSNGPGHLHIFDSGRTVGVNGAGAETTRVEVVVRNGRIWTAYPH
jgi:hypothetical protein